MRNNKQYLKWYVVLITCDTFYFAWVLATTNLNIPNRNVFSDVIIEVIL